MRGAITLILVLLSFNLASAVQSPPPVQGVVNSEKEKLAALEKSNQELKAQISKLEESNKSLSTEWADYRPVLQWWKFILGSVFGIGSIAAAYAIFWKIPQTVKKEYEAQIAKIFTDRRKDFLALLKEYDVDQEVKKNNRIILLTHRNGSDDYHHELLTKHGFKVYPYTRVDALAAALAADDITPNDVIIINNEGGHWLPAEVQQFIHDNPHCCFYIGRGSIDLQGDALNRFAAANFRAQFIGNLMNILRYRN